MIFIQVVFNHSCLSTADRYKLFINPSWGHGRTRLRFIREIYDWSFSSIRTNILLLRKDLTYAEFELMFSCNCHISIARLEAIWKVLSWFSLLCFVLFHTRAHCHPFYPLSMKKQSLHLIKMLVCEQVSAHSIIWVLEVMIG